MEISASIQHHPARAELLGPLLAALEPLPVDVAADPEPDGPPAAWRAYRHALETTPADATHRLIVQDDAVVCQRFAAVLELVVAAHPDRLLVLCVCGEPSESARLIRRARDRGELVTELFRSRWVPTVATVWPVELIAPALEFVDAQPWPRAFVADDEIIGRTMRGISHVPLAVVPSIVQHPDVEPSLLGRRRAHAGANPGRVAIWFHDDPFDLWRTADLTTAV